MAQFREEEHPRDNDGKFVKKELEGMSAEELSDKLKIDLDNKNNSKKIKLKNIIGKLKEYKNKPIGTYNYNTGEIVNLTDGYMVTFHQNEPDANGHYKSHFGRYSAIEYDTIANKFAEENDAEVFIGVFDEEPEISFKVKTFEQAKKLMEEHNQDSIWDNANQRLYKNEKRDRTKNPLIGE